MSTTLKLKRSSQTGNAPDTNNIVEGELALNTADAILYSRGGSTIFQIGANITESFTVNPGTAADTITIGSTSQNADGIITLGQSTTTNTINIGNAATDSASTQTINIGGNNAIGGDTVLNLAANTNTASNTAVTIGNSNSTGTNTVAIRGTTTFSNGDVSISSGSDVTVESGNITVNSASGPSVKAIHSVLSASSSSGGFQVVNTSGTSSVAGLSCYNQTTEIDSYATSNGNPHDIKFHFGAGAEKYRLKGNGNFGIGTSNPQERLHVVGDIVATGNVTAYYSDERLKDLKGAIPDALDKVNKLTGYYYTPNALAHSLGVDNTELEVGVSAQEVEEVLPEIVTKSAVGQDEFGEDYKSVHYDKLTPLLIESIKELTKKVTELETKMMEMEK